MRYFGQTKDYWLDHCTLQEWREVWLRELVEQPPAESFLATYFDYAVPSTSSEPTSDEEVVFDLSDCEA